MPRVEIAPDIFWIGVNDYNTELFEGLWPVSEKGVSYNSYLLKDQKNVLIDLVKSSYFDEFLYQIKQVLDPQNLHYIVVNHMEPDHSGTLSLLREVAPQAIILCTPQAQPMIQSFYHLQERIQILKDGEVLNLGKKELQFFFIPFVHWPETMVSYEKSSGILFSCDVFGSYGALQGTIFDDQCQNLDFYIAEALRYYANIVAKFSPMVKKAIAKLSGIQLKVVAPSHGLIWRGNPQQIVELYQKWADFQTTGGEEGITLLYGTMYGATEKATETFMQGLLKSEVPFEVFDVRKIHPSYILKALWQNRGVAVAVPTYETGLFPPLAHLLDLAKRKGITTKKVVYLGSFAWSGGAKRELEKWCVELGWEIIDTLEFKGNFTLKESQKIEELGTKFGKTIKQVFT